MQKFCWAVVSSILIVLGSVGVAAAAELKPALVVLAQDKTPDADERSVIDRLTTMMVRNATHGRYGSTVFLTEELANKFTLERTISQLVRAGRTVDVMVLAAGEDDRISLDGGDLTSGELVETLKPLQALQSGGLRLVYFTGGREMADAWRALGAKAVLAQPSSGDVPGLAPFFFPHFIKQWSSGMSATHAAAAASAFSSNVVKAFSSFVDDRTLSENSGVVAPAPIFEGEDVNIEGKVSARAARLSAVTWPKDPSRQSFVHTNLGTGVLESLARVFTNRFDVNARFVPGIADFMAALGEPGWQTLYTVFPGRTQNELVVPGGDVRVILQRVLPGIDKYMGTLIDNLETMVVTRNNGKLGVDVWLTPGNGLEFKLRDRAGSKTGQPYAVKLRQHAHLNISSLRDSITIDDIQGISAMIKLPIVPDGVSPRKLYLDTSTETLTITAKAIGGTIGVIATADVRSRQFKGVDWVATMFKNLPLLLGLFLFSPF